jgi:hypothetical protein
MNKKLKIIYKIVLAICIIVALFYYFIIFSSFCDFIPCYFLGDLLYPPLFLILVLLFPRIASLLRGNNKNKIIAVIILLFFIFGFFLLNGINKIELNEAVKRISDRGKESDIRQISLAMEMYYDSNNSEYLQSATMPSDIGTFLNPVPLNHQDNSPYNWINNLSAGACGGMEEGQWYCVYATLVSTTTELGGILSNQKGVKQLSWASTSILNNINCCLW